MTLDEAIKICEEDAEKIGGNPQSDRHAERCRQLAEWLTELKKAKSMLLDSSYTVDIMCNKISGTIGCEKCTYYNAETHYCEVRAYISKTRAFVKGDEAQ